MKYKVGDIVTVKSIDWYNKNKDAMGNIILINFGFLEEMNVMCGRNLTISEVCTDFYRVKEHHLCWIDEMFENGDENIPTRPKVKIKFLGI